MKLKQLAKKIAARKALSHAQNNRAQAQSTYDSYSNHTERRKDAWSELRDETAQLLIAEGLC